MNKVGILYNNRIDAATEFSKEVEWALLNSGIHSWKFPAVEEAKALDSLDGTGMVISLGGDGTMLRVARLVSELGTPILGINLGSLGFTTELGKTEALEKLDEFIAGKAWIDERAMLEVELPDEVSRSTLHALNDIVVGRGSIVRVIQIAATINEQPLTTYKADGVIVATATGSTGYSLAAGGPILFPNAQEFLLTPITPHLGLGSGLVLAADSVVQLEVQTAHEARVSIDGQIEFGLLSESILKIRRSPCVTRLLRIQPRSFYHQTLLRKLNERTE